MNRHLAALFLATALCTAAEAQSASGSAQASGQGSAQAKDQHLQASGNASAASAASANSGSVNEGMSSGSAFNAALTKPVDARKAKPGDRVDARTAEAVKSENKTVLPKGTKLIGHVTQASARAKGESQSALAIVFDRAVLKNGQEVPLNVSIQALASAETLVAGSEPDVDTVGMGSARAGASDATRGALGGVSSPASGVVGGAAKPAGNIGSATGNVVNTAAGTTAGAAGTVGGTAAGLNTAGQFTSSSRGVFGLNGLSLDSTAVNATQGSIITSAGKNIRLANGTRMLLGSNKFQPIESKREKQL